jgi:glycosyltransferase involved in cell wall biosynthesis
VHARAKAYVDYGHEVLAFALGASRRWQFEGIAARQETTEMIHRAIVAWAPDALALHAPYFRLIDVAQRVPVPQVVWVHGHEVLWDWGGFRHGVHRADRFIRAVKTPGRLMWQSVRVRRFLRRSARIVFVSDWMHRATERYTLARYPQGLVIPNPVDTERFGYRWDVRNLSHGVTARSLNSRKYGVDLAIRAFARAGGADLTVAGKGSLEPSLRRLARRTRAAVQFTSRFVPHGEMPSLYGHFGFFVAASRVEAQGVAMCEAMACGLPVVGTRVGGIPEFVADGRSGALVPPGSWQALGQVVERLVADPTAAARLSETARHEMEAKCAVRVVVPREIEVLRGAAG